MSENDRQSQTNAVINDKLQGTVVTYLRCGGIVNNQIKTGLLLSLPVKGLRRMLRVSWTAKKTNEWVLNKAGVKRELLDTVKACNFAKCHQF